jgi:tripartite-type tricarboxylate transporter receptor subunit TctC
MKRISLVIAAATLALAAGTALADSFPTRPITLVVPFAPGGGVDTYARSFSATAAKGVVKVPIVVQNVAGSGGINGAISASKARPDGYTVLVTSGASLLLSTMTKKTEIDALETFEYVAQIGDLTTSIMVPKDSPYKTVQDLIAAAKSVPGKLRWAHSGRGSFHHLAGMGLLEKNGIKAQDVPFKGGGPARAALIGGQVDFGFLGIQQLAGFEGQLRALAVNANERDGVMKDVPSLAELKVPFTNISSPIILQVPKGTPANVIAVLEKAAREVTNAASFGETLVKSGTAPAFLGSQDAKKMMSGMKADITPLVRALGE